MATRLEELQTTGQIARDLRVSREWVHQLIKRGKLPARMTAAGYLIDPLDAAMIRQEREARQAGKPVRAA